MRFVMQSFRFCKDVQVKFRFVKVFQSEKDK